jgi:hypothetical protein
MPLWDNMAGIVSKSEVASIVGGKGHHHRCHQSGASEGEKHQKSGLLSFRGGVGSSRRKVY